jgi:hypothetical protein
MKKLEAEEESHTAVKAQLLAMTAELGTTEEERDTFKMIAAVRSASAHAQEVSRLV